MFAGANLIALIGLLCSFIGVVVAIINLDKYPKIRFALLAIFFGAVFALLWTATNGFSRMGSAIAVKRLEEVQNKAREDVEREYIKQQESEQAIKERSTYEAARQAELERHALREAETAILGSWKCSTLATYTFNSDSTLGEFGLHVETYRFVDSRHIEVAGFFGLGPKATWEVNLTGSDRYLRWSGVVCGKVP